MDALFGVYSRVIDVIELSIGVRGAVMEAKVGFGVLRGVLGDAIDTSDEKCGSNWRDRCRASQVAFTPPPGGERRLGHHADPDD